MTKKKATKKVAKRQAKKATKKKATAKTKTQQQLGDWDNPDIPKVVRRAAEQLATEKVKLKNQKARTDVKRDNLLAVMKENGCKLCPVLVDGVKEWVEIEAVSKIKFVKDKKKKAEKAQRAKRKRA